MDRLVDLSGKGHGLQSTTEPMSKPRSAKSLGQVTIVAALFAECSWVGKKKCYIYCFIFCHFVKDNKIK